MNNEFSNGLKGSWPQIQSIPLLGESQSYTRTNIANLKTYCDARDKADATNFIAQYTRNSSDWVENIIAKVQSSNLSSPAFAIYLVYDFRGKFTIHFVDDDNGYATWDSTADITNVASDTRITKLGNTIQIGSYEEEPRAATHRREDYAATYEVQAITANGSTTIPSFVTTDLTFKCRGKPIRKTYYVNLLPTIPAHATLTSNPPLTRGRNYGDTVAFTLRANSGYKFDDNTTFKTYSYVLNENNFDLY